MDQVQELLLLQTFIQPVGACSTLHSSNTDQWQRLIKVLEACITSVSFTIYEGWLRSSHVPSAAMSNYTWFQSAVLKWRVAPGLQAAQHSYRANIWREAVGCQVGGVQLSGLDLCTYNRKVNALNPVLCRIVSRPLNKALNPLKNSPGVADKWVTLHCDPK